MSWRGRPRGQPEKYQLRYDKKLRYWKVIDHLRTLSDIITKEILFLHGEVSQAING